MPISSSAIPGAALVPSNGRLFYGLDICPLMGTFLFPMLWILFNTVLYTGSTS